MTVHRYKRGDRVPPLSVSLDRGPPLSASDSVTLYVDNPDGTLEADFEMDVVDGETVRYEWADGDLDVPAGAYEFEVVVEYDTDGRRLTHPPDTLGRIIVEETITRPEPE